jgi:hypothetical protein
MSRNPAPLGNIKNHNGKSRYKQGKFIPQYPDKYIGNTPILYRSSWEFAFCKFCDINEKVSKWSTESIVIPFQITDNGKTKNRRFFPDFYLEMIGNDPEKYDRIIIEIKPKHELGIPTPPKRQTLKMLENYEYAMRTYKNNIHKWAYAKKWCESRHMKFIIITEDDLKKRGLIS